MVSSDATVLPCYFSNWTVESDLQLLGGFAAYLSIAVHDFEVDFLRCLLLERLFYTRLTLQAIKVPKHLLL